MFSILWGICFSLEANLHGLKTSSLGTVPTQRERLLFCSEEHQRVRKRCSTPISGCAERLIQQLKTWFTLGPSATTKSAPPPIKEKCGSLARLNSGVLAISAVNNENQIGKMIGKNKGCYLHILMNMLLLYRQRDRQNNEPSYPQRCGFHGAYASPGSKPEP
jgi:hypothetical protein